MVNRRSDPIMTPKLPSQLESIEQRHYRVDLMLGQRWRRWTNVNAKLVQCVVAAEISQHTVGSLFGPMS